MFVDVHTHLTHEKFNIDLDDVLDRSKKHGLGAIIVNGLHPNSNRQILEMANQHAIIKAALGIYPIEAVNSLEIDLPFTVNKFDVFEEIRFIESQAKAGRLTAIGECGLDGYWVREETFPLQEKVFESLIQIAIQNDLPLIIHTRKREQRAMEILRHYKAPKVNFHCYCGKVKAAIKGAEDEGWYFSIPANARRSESFCKMLEKLPKNLILTETDAPYLAPDKGSRNEPSQVVRTVELMAEIRGIDVEEAKNQVWNNYQTLFL